MMARRRHVDISPPRREGGIRSYPRMPAIDRRPPRLASGYREGAVYQPGRGWGLPLRDDLILKPWARALGYRIQHRLGNWHNEAVFHGPNAPVWAAAEGWQARDLADGIHHGPRRVYGDRALSLLTALIHEAPLLLTHQPEA